MRMDAKGLVLLLRGRPVVALTEGQRGDQDRLRRWPDVPEAPVPAGWAVLGVGSGKGIMTTPSPVTLRDRARLEALTGPS